MKNFDAFLQRVFRNRMSRTDFFHWINMFFLSRYTNEIEIQIAIVDKWYRKITDEYIGRAIFKTVVSILWSSSASVSTSRPRKISIQFFANKPWQRPQRFRYSRREKVWNSRDVVGEGINIYFMSWRFVFSNIYAYDITRTRNIQTIMSQGTIVNITRGEVSRLARVF